MVSSLALTGTKRNRFRVGKISCQHVMNKVCQVKRLALQRDIDQESLPQQPSKSNHRCAPLQRPEEKMEINFGDVIEENVEKKNKKRKKEQTLPPKMDDPTIADGNPHSVEKKKKKVKKEGSGVQILEFLEIGGELKEKRKMKTKVVNVSNSIDGNGKEAKIKKKLTDRQEGTEKTGNKKKSKNKTQIEHENICLDEKVAKKAKKEKTEFQYINGSHVTDDNVVSKKKREEKKSERKKKKMTDKVTQIEHENVGVAVEAEKVPKKAKKEHNKMPIVRDEEKIKHKAKKKKDKVEQDEITVTKKKKLAKLKLAERVEAAETPDGQEVDGVKLKKKKKKNASPDNGKPEDTIEEAQKEEKVTKSKVGIGEGGRKRGKKGEKATKKKSYGLGTEEETQSTKKKKLKVEENQEQSKESKKKISFRELKPVEEVYSYTNVMKMIKKEKGINKDLYNQVDARQADVVFLSEKTGNTDEVTINQERRQALQMEIDKASRPQQVRQPSGFGQWGTAQFESSQQKHKFLRLMGGFKKGFQPAAAASIAKPNMALCKDAQEHLQQGLMGEFDRAHSRRIDLNSRGAGLGFSELSKKFTIDVNTCRSVRFDD
ncbi:lysine-rich nucleolar protein 1 isoform X2 [Phyllopteryx taeniolatus]|uniref:lysine-rich nucleolar protein 1 isoform X2 n=1 Tax=Phyllopteryx taeniolatus TaxID=161469 RepID=UPI002AD52A4F|nr:lysine-rich nucleolar protein 1 isoform X2 [Phyllopteryx taeniolatus]